MATSEGSTARTASQVTPDPSRRPRIVFLHYSAPPIVGGVEAVIARHVQLFSAAGFPTLILAGRKPDELPQDVGPVTVISEMDSQHPHYLEMVPALEGGSTPPSFKELQAAIESGMAGALQPDDIVIAHNVLTTHFNLALTAAVHHMAGEDRFPRLLAWCHDISRHVNPARPEPQYHGQPWDLLRTPLPGAAYVAVSTARQHDLAGILGLPPDSIRVIPNGVDAAQLLGLSPLAEHLAQSYGLLSADLVILMPVRITRVKNIEFAMQVVDELRRSGLSVRLIITGPPDPHSADIPDYFASLLALQNELGLQQEVRFVHEGTGQVRAPLLIDESVVAALYRVSDLILMPSLREGFGMPVLEAALVGRPVFATSIPVTQELSVIPGLIEPGEPADSVARRIGTWAASDSAHQLRIIARRDYTWSHIFSNKILPLVEAVHGARLDASQ